MLQHGARRQPPSARKLSYPLPDDVLPPIIEPVPEPDGDSLGQDPSTVEVGRQNRYDDDYLEAIFGMTSEQIQATGTSVEAYIIHNAKKALKEPKAKAVYLSRMSPAKRALQRWREIAVKCYIVMFTAYGLLLISAIPSLERSEPSVVDALRWGAEAVTVLAVAIAVPALRSYFKYLKLRRSGK